MPKMTAAPSGYGEEAGDGPEAWRDASPLPGGGNGSVCCHHLLYPGYHSAASLPEKVETPNCLEEPQPFLPALPLTPLSKLDRQGSFTLQLTGSSAGEANK